MLSADARIYWILSLFAAIVFLLLLMIKKIPGYLPVDIFSKTRILRYADVIHNYVDKEENIPWFIPVDNILLITDENVQKRSKNTVPVQIKKLPQFLVVGDILLVPYQKMIFGVYRMQRNYDSILPFNFFIHPA